jgi:hypothetical protein
MTRDEWKARYRAMRVAQAMHEAGPRRAPASMANRGADLAQLLHRRAEALRPRLSARRRRINATISSAMALLILALMTAALLSSADRTARAPQPILVSAPITAGPMAAPTPI